MTLLVQIAEASFNQFLAVVIRLLREGKMTLWFTCLLFLIVNSYIVHRVELVFQNFYNLLKFFLVNRLGILSRWKLEKFIKFTAQPLADRDLA